MYAYRKCPRAEVHKKKSWKIIEESIIRSVVREEPRAKKSVRERLITIRFEINTKRSAGKAGKKRMKAKN